MDQAKLLLLVLGIPLVGLAIYAGVSMFGAYIREGTRNGIILDLQNLSTRALA